MLRMLSFIFLAVLALSGYAQSDGPRAHLPAPTGVWAINAKYMNLDQNLLPSWNLLIKDADINADVFPITLIHTFSIKKRWARVYMMAAPVTSLKGSIQSDQSLPRTSIESSGFSDGWISFETTLKGNPAMNVVEFAKQPPAFTINFLFRLWYSGTYSSDKIINLGTNRMAFDVGFPMAIPLGKDPERMTWIETWPGIQIFTANNDPAKTSMADKITQRPLFYWENHLSHSFNPKLYAGVDLRFQQGGQTLTDEVEDDNTISVVGGGIFAGYKFLPFLDFYANYGGILWGDNDARSRMIRLSLTFSYINTKKLAPAGN